MRVRLLAITTLLGLAALAGCMDDSDSGDAGGAAGQATAQRIAPAEWTKGLSDPVYTGIVATVERIAADDGTALSLHINLPEGLPSDGRVPTLLQLTPYQPLAGRTSTPAGTDSVGGGPLGGDSSWGDFVLRGAAYVEADARGTGGSEGCLDFGGSADRADAVTFADWIRAQPWSNGVVVTDGISHPGMGSVVAHAADAKLTGALAHAPVVSYYRDEWYEGAKFEDQANGAGYQAIELAPPAYLEPGAAASQAAPCTGRMLTDYNALDGRFGPLWGDRDLSRHREAATAPILLTQGFVDQNVHPDHVQLYWDSLPADFPKSVIWGWWYHGWPDMEDHPADAADDDLDTFAYLRHRWLDHLLFGADNGLDAEPRVLVEDSQGTWHEGHDWPLEPSEVRTFWANEDGDLAAAIPATEAAYDYPDAVGAQRGVWDGAHVAFRTDPLDGDLLVNGAPRVDLVASSSAEATKWVVYLMDEAPDGSWQRVTHGYIDSHQWDGEETWKAIDPGTPYTWSFMLMPTAVVVQDGHRLTLVVASSDSHNTDPMGDRGVCFDDHTGGCYDPSGILPAPESYGRATNTVHVGPEGTRIHVAVVDPALTAKVPWAPQ